MAIDLIKKAQIEAQKKAQIITIIFDKAFTKVLVKYFNYNNVFLVKNIIKLSEYIGMNNDAIKLEKIKYQLFGLIYSQKLIKLETLKTYIETNLANNFICLFKSLFKILILFDWKLDKRLRFCVNY